MPKPLRNNPAISIIVPVYNAARFLRQTVESVRSGKFSDFELILVDDVSTDNSPEICRQLAADDSRIRFIRLEKNGGPGIARNRGIDTARGEFIGFLDADDRFGTDALSLLVAAAMRENADIVRGAMGDFYSDSDKQEEIAKVPPYSDETVVVAEKPRLRLMALQTFAAPIGSDENLCFGGSACSAIFRRALIEDKHIRFTEIPHAMNEDYLFCFDALMEAQKVVVVPDLVYHYRKVPTSRCNLPRLDVLDRALRSAQAMEQRIAKAGFPPESRFYAMRFAIDITRAFSKLILLSPLPAAEKRSWFHRSSRNPLLRRCHDEFPTQCLSAMHRAAFTAFMADSYPRTILLLRLRELLRRIHR